MMSAWAAGSADSDQAASGEGSGESGAAAPTETLRRSVWKVVAVPTTAQAGLARHAVRRLMLEVAARQARAWVGRTVSDAARAARPGTDAASVRVSKARGMVTGESGAEPESGVTAAGRGGLRIERSAPPPWAQERWGGWPEAPAGAMGTRSDGSCPPGAERHSVAPGQAL